MQVNMVNVWSWGWFGKLDSKPVKMWDENGSGFRPVGKGLRVVKTCSKGHCSSSGLGGLHSQAKKLFRSGLIMVGPDWLNVTLHRGLVLWPCIDLVPVEFPVGSWHCWNLPWWISSQGGFLPRLGFPPRKGRIVSLIVPFYAGPSLYFMLYALGLLYCVRLIVVCWTSRFIQARELLSRTSNCTLMNMPSGRLSTCSMKWVILFWSRCTNC